MFCTHCTCENCETCRNVCLHCRNTGPSEAQQSVKPSPKQKHTQPVSDEHSPAVTEKAQRIRESLASYLFQHGIDGWEETDSTETLRALVHKKLGRFSFTDGTEREYSKTYYYTFRWEYKPHKFIAVTIAARYNIAAQEWEYGVAWQNPLDKSAPNLAKKIARKKMVEGNGYISSTNTNPDWYEILAYDVLGEHHHPRWTGNEAQRLENLAQLWREVHEGSDG